MPASKAPDPAPFTGELPDGIDPAAHGVPWERAADLFGNPAAWSAQVGALRALWCDCGYDPAGFASVRAAVVDALRHGKAVPALDLLAPPAVPDKPKLGASVAKYNELVRQWAGAKEAAERFASIPESALRLLTAERARIESFFVGLRGGILQAFGRPRDRRGPFVWIAPHEWEGRGLSLCENGSLTGGGLSYYDVHVHDRIGLPLRLARHAYGPPDLVCDLAALEARGAGILAFVDWGLACELHKVGCLIDERLAEDLATGRLAQPGKGVSVPSPDPWSGKRGTSFLNFIDIRLPAPKAEPLAGGVSETREAGAGAAPNPEKRAEDWILRQLKEATAFTHFACARYNALNPCGIPRFRGLREASVWRAWLFWGCPSRGGGHHAD